MVVLRASPQDGAQSRIVRNSVRRAILVGRAGVAPSIGDAQLDIEPHICAPSSPGPPDAAVDYAQRMHVPARASGSLILLLLRRRHPSLPVLCCTARQASTGSISCLLASPCSGIQLPSPSQPVLSARGRHGVPAGFRGPGRICKLRCTRANHGVRRPASSPQRAKFVLLQPAILVHAMYKQERGLGLGLSAAAELELPVGD